MIESGWCSLADDGYGRHGQRVLRDFWLLSSRKGKRGRKVRFGILTGSRMEATMMTADSGCDKVAQRPRGDLLG